MLIVEYLGIPLAGSYFEMGELPARLVDDMLLFKTARSDIEREKAEEQERKSGGKGNASAKSTVKRQIAERRRAQREAAKGRRPE